MKLTLFFSLLCLVTWLVFGFIRPFGLGVINLLWALAVVLWIRWFALRNPLTAQPPAGAPSEAPRRS